MCWQRTAAWCLASWWVAQASAVSKGLTVIDLDGVKTGEHKYPGGSGKFCGDEVLKRLGFTLSDFSARLHYDVQSAIS
jgi:hypothetical protein